MIETFTVELPGGVRLACRATGNPGAPLVLLLHGFPEASFIWDEVMQRLSGQYRCVAPDLRGYGGSSAPAPVEAYSLRSVASDIHALAQHLEADAATLVGHDWGGAVAWAVGAAAPAWLERLVIINAPHPVLFLEALRHDPIQQRASDYMNFLCRPDAEQLLVADDFARMWDFFTGMGAVQGRQPGAGWLSESVRDRYREVWRQGIAGALNYYRASPVRPAAAGDERLQRIQLPVEATRIRAPTLVIWAEADIALGRGLLDGLDQHVDRLTVARVPEATHWIVHEQPTLVADTIDRFLAGRPVDGAGEAPPPGGT